MTTAGYSGRPVAVKLGYKPGFRYRLENAPADYDVIVGELPEGALQVQDEAELDLVHVFVMSEEQLAVRLPELRRMIASNGMIWISWPKKSSGIESDLSDSVVRRHGLQNELVDIKVCAVNEVWSALKFVIPKKLR